MAGDSRSEERYPEAPGSASRLSGEAWAFWKATGQTSVTGTAGVMYWVTSLAEALSGHCLVKEKAHPFLWVLLSGTDLLGEQWLVQPMAEMLLDLL